jgi:hypothetical protein
MNPVQRILTSAIMSINRLIDSFSLQTAETIKRGFFFLIFLISLIGIYAGYNMGTKAAKIKSSPIAEFVNDTFKIDINKEKARGNFSDILESEIINETTMNNFNKSVHQVRETMNPELSKEVIESKNKIPEPDVIDKPFKPETPIDEKINTDQKQNDSGMKILDKSHNDGKTENIILKQEENKAQSHEKKSDDKNIIKIIQKDKPAKPEPIKKDTGIIIK